MSLKPITGIKPEDKGVERPSVTVGDSIYYKHPETGHAHHGVVAAIGKDGVTTDADGGGEHQVRWDGYLGHRKRAERKLTIVDRGEDGTIMEDENGKRVYVRGQLADYEQPLEKAEGSVVSPEQALLQKAQIVRELSAAGFEPMMDYVRDNFGERFVYRQPAEVKEDRSAEVINAVDRLRSEINANFQGLCAAISVMADKIGDTAAMQQALIAALGEARKPQDVTFAMPDGSFQKSVPVHVDVHVPAQPAPVVNVEAPNVTVTPSIEVPPAAVTVNVPDRQEVAIVEMPTRKTETSVERDRDGNLSRSVQTESDAK